MNQTKFAELALQLLNASTIPGAAIEDAFAFKKEAEKLLHGQKVIITPSDQRSE